MDRLTDKYSDGTPFVPERILQLTNGMQGVIKKLAHYEDLEEQGRLIEVVRCKDCHHRIERCGMGSHRWCEIWEGTTGENDFCSYGVARAEIEKAEANMEAKLKELENECRNEKTI